MSFTVDDLLILQDKQELDTFVHPEIFFQRINNWFDLSREERQKIIATYVDNVEIEKENNSVEVKHYNMRKSFIIDTFTYHSEYGLPLNFPLFEDDYGYPIPMNKKVKTRENARKYFDKLQTTLGTDYKLNYYEIDIDDDLKDMHFSSNNEIEKIVRLIGLQDESTYTIQNLKLGIITINLSDIKDKNGNQLYKGFFEKFKEECEKYELCYI